MISFKGNYYNLNNSKNETLDFVNDSLMRSYEAIDYFFDYLQLDKTLFSHLKNVDIVVDNNEEAGLNNMAAYFIVRDNITNEPVIHLSSTYVDKVLTISKRDLQYNDSVNQLAWSIIHETIHCNRCIIIDSLITLQDTNIILHGDSKKFKNTYIEIEDLLSNYYNPNKEPFIYDILKVIEDREYYDVYSYNEKEDRYEFYLIDKKDIVNFSMTELNKFLTINYIKNYLCNKPYGTIKRNIKYNEEDMVMNYDLDSCSIMVPFEKEESIKEKEKISLNEGLEESITEVFAGLIIIMNKDRSLNIYEACDILRQIINNYDIQLGIELVKNMSLDDIRWFFLSCYQDEYNNRFKEIYSEEYDKLLECFSELYKNTTDLSKENKEFLTEGKNIIYRNKVLKK
ncbi:MAG: hypothetical protein IKR57_03355 [Bacilli bacterium]|nr:hypothetical protein [Bacilli bacterium]